MSVLKPTNIFRHATYVISDKGPVITQKIYSVEAKGMIDVPVMGSGIAESYTVLEQKWVGLDGPEVEWKELDRVTFLDGKEQ